MNHSTARKGRASAGRVARESNLEKRIGQLEREIALLSLSDRFRKLTVRVARLEEERGIH